MQVTKANTPEERELAEKQAKLEELRTRIAEAELEYHTVRAQLAAFEADYFRIVGVKLAKLDELHAQLAEAQARLQPQSETLQKTAEDARRQADETAQAFEEEIAAAAPRMKERPDEDCRKLYLRAAKLMHPDLAATGEEKERRHNFMAALNEAYEAGDAAAIQRVLDDWNASPESVPGDGIGAELIRVIRQIAQVEKRFQEIEEAMEALRQGDLYGFWQTAVTVDEDCGFYLEQIAAKVTDEIQAIEETLRLLQPANGELQ